MKNTALVLLLALVVVLGLGAYAYTQKLVTLNEDAPRNATEEQTREMTQVKVPVFTEGGDIVCGAKMVYLERTVPKTLSVLNAAFGELFAMPEPYETGQKQYQNPIGYQTSKTDFPKLSFDRVTLENGVASVYLEGSITGVGTCYDPLPKIQMDATAKQFPTVTSVKYYLNGRETDPGCIADQRGEVPCYTGAGE